MCMTFVVAKSNTRQISVWKLFPCMVFTYVLFLKLNYSIALRYICFIIMSHVTRFPDTFYFIN